MARKAKVKRGRGRPTLCTPELTKAIAEAIERGHYIEVAAALNGINAATLHRWLKRGEREVRRVAKNVRFKIRKAERPYVEFSKAVKKADAKAEDSDLQSIRGDTSWQSKAWRLERKHPSRWGRRTEHVVASPPSAPEPDSEPERFAESRAALAPLVGDRDALAALRIVVDALEVTDSDSPASGRNGANGSNGQTPPNDGE